MTVKEKTTKTLNLTEEEIEIFGKASNTLFEIFKIVGPYHDISRGTDEDNFIQGYDIETAYKVCDFLFDSYNLFINEN